MVTRALVVVEDEGSAVALEGMTACYAVEIMARAEEVLAATCVGEDNYDPESDQHWEACLTGPFLLGSCPGACPCSEGGGAFGQGASVYAVGSWETEPSTVDEAGAGRLGEGRLGLTVVGFEQPDRIDFHLQ